MLREDGPNNKEKGVIMLKIIMIPLVKAKKLLADIWWTVYKRSPSQGNLKRYLDSALAAGKSAIANKR